MFGHPVNTLLGLGCVRPWMTWRAEGHPKNHLFEPVAPVSTSQSSFALRLAKIDAFLVYIHCQKPYSPVVRAPKAGQRNFCPGVLWIQRRSRGFAATSCASSSTIGWRTFYGTNPEFRS
jgi:hypothetical protein